MRRAHRLPASVAAWALVVPVSLLGLSPPVDPVAPVAVAIDAQGTGSTTTVSLSSGITVFGLPVAADVTVTAPGTTPTGPVRLLVDGTAVASAALAADGTVRVPLPATVAAGRHTVTATYSGDPPVPPSSGVARTLTVTRTLPAVRTDGTDWSVRRADAKVVRVQLAGVADRVPTGTVVVWVNGLRKGTAAVDPTGSAVVPLALATRTALVVVTYSGDGTYLPWVAAPRALVVR